MFPEVNGPPGFFEPRGRGYGFTFDPTAVFCRQGHFFEPRGRGYRFIFVTQLNYLALRVTQRSVGAFFLCEKC